MGVRGIVCHKSYGIINEEEKEVRKCLQQTTQS